MKKVLALFFIAILIIACKEEEKTIEEKETVAAVKTIAPVSNEMMESAVIYEANIRQYSKEGSFNAFTQDIPELKKLGVKIIWLMPVFPISETKRKATGGDFASLIKDPEERAKALGSYYAVSDFKKINPEFGTIEDFRTLVQTAHDNDMYVILDWVPNHTGWDHTWIKTNPEFYTKNEKGEITDPLNEDGIPVGWADVADLNYDNQELRKTMIADMKHWIVNENIDGFRCDVAGSVPTEFWQQAVPALRAEKPIFMLAEAWEPELLKDNLFDMGYGWDRHHTMNHIATGEKPTSEWDITFTKDTTRYEANDILMTFVTNHDENSWNGTIKERMGDAAEAMTALSYVSPGMPLIYSGQEYDLNHRLLFFEKDEIPHAKGKMWSVLEKLGQLKANDPALHGGKNAASYERIYTGNETVLAFKRSKAGKTVIYVANLSEAPVEVNLPDVEGEFLDYMVDSKITIDKVLTLDAKAYKLLVK